VDLKLTGKKAIVTGASEGIGRAVVEELAAEGCDVAFCARRGALLEEIAETTSASKGRRMVPLIADLSKRAEIDEFVEKAAAELGGIDIVVNNAGASIFGELLEVPDERWLQDIELKLMSYVRTSRAAIPHLRNAGGGRIVHVGGNGGRQPMSYHLPGGSSNAAILNFTVSLARYLASDGIHVLNCAPGPVRTARFIKQVTANAELWNVEFEEAEKRFTDETPLGYIPTPEEIAGVVTFLTSERAAYMTGTTVTVDGGITQGI
jgi:NAD(P)-dependent dehydrogenase (short-subunit alcohol dehydrogenase family)